MNYWIRERHNPQLGIYYVACGQLSKKEAKKCEKALYGKNYMLPFPTKEAYEAEIKRLKTAGESVRGA